MCGRFMFEPEANSEIQRIYQLACQSGQKPATGEIFPNDLTAVVITQKQKIKVTTMNWGFPGFKKGQKIINARAETLEQKTLFARPFKFYRAVYPTTGFFEWNQNKEKFWFNYSTKAQPLYIAGFYDYFQKQPHGIIITTAPNQTVASVHNRMPLLLQKKQIIPWLTNMTQARQLLTQTQPLLTAIVQAAKT